MNQVSLVLENLERVGYKAIKDKSKQEVKWLGYRLTKDGITPLRETTEAIKGYTHQKT